MLDRVFVSFTGTLRQRCDINKTETDTKTCVPCHLNKTLIYINELRWMRVIYVYM